jgi:hypothetical protein
VKRYLLNWLVLLDQAGNTLLGGSPNETISSRAGKAWGCILCKLLDYIQPNHCAIAMAVQVGDDAVIPDDIPPTQS